MMIVKTSKAGLGLKSAPKQNHEEWRKTRACEGRHPNSGTADDFGWKCHFEIILRLEIFTGW